ncbi:TetR/AcrR family transcriptional regulator [Parasporobacterium paucivorans]|uniref:Transcriptional regulator, TetR family n=1 Tax=Parasporobacterium paucivorans DSM 15970 TaxID=1122934 RepID=A0A1M6K518_9FIRM|nr:TetR/AcrR family transcriptional regulator [Parasporobacterium paucivorans]SHJ54012.1 transcriptional regulator, TetR family [Parasporobacterium paucivorans DSM 15970]
MGNKISTKEKILEAACRLFETKGYNATGLNEILKESGAPKGSLYYHFPNGKEELALAAINLAGENIRDNIKNNFGQISNPVEAIMGNIETIAAIIDSGQKHADISISLMALEMYTKSESLRTACENVFVSLEKMYAEILVKSGMSKDLAGELGETISIMIEGGITLSLTKKKGDPLRLIAKQIPNLF